MNDLYNEYLGNSSIVLDTWFGNIKTMIWELLLLLVYIVLCWLIFKLIVKAASRLLRITKIEKLNDLYEKIDVLKKINVRIDLQKIIITDRKSTRLNSSHVRISYAVFCLKKKKK